MAKKIFEVEISNRGPRGYETAALLKMPATWGEFNDALQKARIEDGRCCQNELTRIEYPGIQREMIGDNVDLYELNLLAQRLSELSKDDQMGMDGLLQIEKIHSTGPISLPRLINLTFNADSIPPPYCVIIMATMWEGEYHVHRERRVDHAGTGLV